MPKNNVENLRAITSRLMIRKYPTSQEKPDEIVEFTSSVFLFASFLTRGHLMGISTIILTIKVVADRVRF
jgi:hypothetical protein